MKKIRYIPYGYTMRNGRTVISTEEAEVIRDIFKAYVPVPFRISTVAFVYFSISFISVSLKNQ